jgi:hypothetical protein
MTQKEKLLALLREFDVTPGTVADGDERLVTLAAHRGNVEGYGGSECIFSFRPDGSFNYVAVVE